MLDGIRKATQHGVGRVVMTFLLGLLIIAFAAWGIGDMFRGFTSDKVAQVGPTVITGREFQNEFQNLVYRYQRMYKIPLTNAQAGENNFIWASKACEAQGGWLPSASELVGAAERVKLESTIHDNPDAATVNLDPSRGLKDEREMSSTLITTEAGSAAAGSEGVSEGATGDPRQGGGNPIPVAANPLPESLQYVTVYDNGNLGGFAGSEPVKEAQNFRCAFTPTPGALNKPEE